MKRAFTLIELLVVIAIIAILAAILFPVFAQAKTSAKRTQGIAQMKQIGLALQLYAADFDDGAPTWNTCFATYPITQRPVACPTGNFAAYRHWDALLQPYVRSGNPHLSDFSGLWQSPGAPYTVGRSLGINQLVMWDIAQQEIGGSPAPDDPTQSISMRVGNGAFYWLNLSAADTVSETVYVGDSGRAGRLDPAWWRNAFRDTYITRVPSWAQPWRYGNDGANYVRLDTSARYERGDRLFPNPGRTAAVFATWPAPWPTHITASAICQAARWQAPRADQKEMLVQAAASLGVTCQ